MLTMPIKHYDSIYISMQTVHQLNVYLMVTYGTI